MNQQQKQLLAEIIKTWNKFPNLRFGQLIVNCLCDFEEDMLDIITDESLVIHIKNFKNWYE